MVTYNEIFVIIVIYNIVCNDSITYNAVKQISDINIIVCDNSTIDINNKSIVESDGYLYINMYGNNGISKAYNRAIEMVPKSNRNYICLLDDDTFIKESYFQKAIASINRTQADIYLPIVKTESRIMSPCILKNNYIKQIQDIKELDLKEVSAINSGMIINSLVFKEYRYDEMLFLDYVDHNFMKYIKKKGLTIFLMEDNFIYQNFSMENNSKQADYNRLCILNKDLKYFYKDRKFAYWRQISLYKLVMIKKHKSLKFLCLNNCR